MTPALFSSTGYHPTPTPNREAPAMTESEIDQTFTDRDGDDLLVETAYVAEYGAFVKAAGGAFVAPADAPAVALAILRAAGLSDRTGVADTPYFVARAVRTLETHAAKLARDAEAASAAEAKAAAEKADAEKLDAEALTLWQATPGGCGATDLPVSVRDKYRAIARAARALHNPEPDAAPVKPRFQVIDHDGDPYVVDNENRRAWRFGSAATARECLPLIVANQAWGYSKTFTDYGIDQRTPSGRFALATFKTPGSGLAVRYGIWDRERAMVASFGSASRASASRALRAGDQLAVGAFHWTPTSELTDLTVI
ncbi:hypothetical protein HOU70_gp55 [Arthrobacter phage Liebe]|uniref:Uncharacterized protein n=1 Tax=Arthrobacter phage Liebe TaxID=2488780 RepID=A0A3G8FG52_9CAUD|nr:hypothetical protein HOU70_gp55 [Arthrobacter phage Liebe]AZF93788.1 hypothetical protein PBI_LIEBE_55 [Arthrobacter phage Liebe]